MIYYIDILESVHTNITKKFNIILLYDSSKNVTKGLVMPKVVLFSMDWPHNSYAIIPKKPFKKEKNEERLIILFTNPKKFQQDIENASLANILAL